MKKPHLKFYIPHHFGSFQRLHVFRNRKRERRLMYLREGMFYAQLGLGIFFFLREIGVSKHVLEQAIEYTDFDAAVVHYFRFLLLGFIIPLSILSRILFRFGWIEDVEKELFEVMAYICWIVLLVLHPLLNS